QYNFFLTDTYRRSGSSPNYSYAEFLSQIKDYTIKHDVDIYLSNSHTLKSGVILTLHAFKPRVFYSKDEGRSEENKRAQTYQTQEFAFYIDDSWKISDRIVANIGLRTAHV